MGLIEAAERARAREICETLETSESARRRNCKFSKVAGFQRQKSVDFNGRLLLQLQSQVLCATT